MVKQKLILHSGLKVVNLQSQRLNVHYALLYCVIMQCLVAQ